MSSGHPCDMSGFYPCDCPDYGTSDCPRALPGAECKVDMELVAEVLEAKRRYYERKAGR